MDMNCLSCRMMTYLMHLLDADGVNFRYVLCQIDGLCSLCQFSVIWQ